MTKIHKSFEIKQSQNFLKNQAFKAVSGWKIWKWLYVTCILIAILIFSLAIWNLVLLVTNNLDYNKFSKGTNNPTIIFFYIIISIIIFVLPSLISLIIKTKYFYKIILICFLTIITAIFFSSSFFLHLFNTFINET